jgi:hypothetical protein
LIGCDGRLKRFEYGLMEGQDLADRPRGNKVEQGKKD